VLEHEESLLVHVALKADHVPEEEVRTLPEPDVSFQNTARSCWLWQSVQVTSPSLRLMKRHIELSLLRKWQE